MVCNKNRVKFNEKNYPAVGIPFIVTYIQYLKNFGNAAKNQLTSLYLNSEVKAVILEPQTGYRKCNNVRCFEMLGCKILSKLMQLRD